MGRRPIAPIPLHARVFLGLLLIASTASLAAQEGTSPPDLREDPLGPVPEIVARVNDVDLTAADLAKQIRRLIPQVSFHQTIPSGRARELRRDALEELILDELKWQEAVREERVASDADVRAEVDRVIAALPEAERLEWLGRELTLVQRHGAAIRRRLTLEDAEATMVPEQPAITEKRITTELEQRPELARLPSQVRMRHLLVKIDPGATREQYENGLIRVHGLRERIVSGTPFGDVARESSDDVFRERGGETDWLAADEIIYGPVARAAFELEPGTLSNVIESLHGFHLIEVIERRQGRTMEPEEARSFVRTILVDAVRAELEDAWHARLRDGAKIERLYDPMDSGTGATSHSDGDEAPTSRPRLRPEE